MKIAALYKDDVNLLLQISSTNSPHKTILDDILKDTTFLSLDSEAIMYPLSQNLPCLSFYSLITSREFEKTWKMAYQAYDAISKTFIPGSDWLDNWPMHDETPMCHFFNTVYFTPIIGKKLISRGMSNLLLMKHEPSIHDFFYLVRNTFFSLITTLFPDMSTPIDIQVNHNDKLHSTLPLNAYSNLKDSVCFFMFDGEDFRQAQFINTVGKNEHTVLVTTHPRNLNEASKHVSVENIKYITPNPTAISSDFAELYQKTFTKIVPTCLEQITDKYVYDKWSRQDAICRHWISIFEKYPPKVCVIASNSRTEMKAISLAAKRTGITTISLPHAYTSLANMANGELYNKDLIISSNVLTEKINRRITNYKIPCYSVKQIDLSIEYDMKIKDIIKRKDSHILFIYGGIQTSTLRLTNAPDEYIKNINNFHNHFLQRKDYISIAYKGHPGTPSFSLLLDAGVDPGYILDPHTNIYSSLQNASAMVAFNYRSGPIFHAMKCGVPVICLQTQPFILAERNPGLQGALIHGDIEVCSVEEAWGEIDKLISDQEYRQALLAKQEEFAKENLVRGKMDFFDLLAQIS